VLQGLQLGPGRQSFVFWAIALACAIKSPLVPFHAWLPRAYGAASPAGTALMAGVLSKMGAYGLLRLAIPLAPDAATAAAPVMVALAVTSILYGAVLALTQRDLKRLVAYASLSHMGYIVLGAFGFTAVGVQGALFQMLSHGVIVAGLFLVLGLAEQRCGTAWLQLDGLATRAPRLAAVTMLFVLASLALPLTSAFTAEFLVLLGAFTRGLASWRAAAGSGLLLAAVLASLGVVLGAAYMLRLARALVFGDARGQARLPDLSARELAALAPLVLVILAVGVRPAPWMAKVEPAVAGLVRIAPQSASPDPARAVPPPVTVAGADRAR
jgi:NADH-quinone oxidoreductase subunit M